MDLTVTTVTPYGAQTVRGSPAQKQKGADDSKEMRAISRRNTNRERKRRFSIWK
jgi:hypothetical protein